MYFGSANETTTAATISTEDAIYESICQEEAEEREAAPEIQMYVRSKAVDKPTNGLEGIVDWDRLEDGLESGWIESTDKFKSETRRQFKQADTEMLRRLYVSTIKGLLPRYREMYAALPHNPSADQLAKDVA